MGVNIEMDLDEISCLNWIQLAQGRVQFRALVNAVTKFRVP